MGKSGTTAHPGMSEGERGEPPGQRGDTSPQPLSRLAALLLPRPRAASPKWHAVGEWCQGSHRGRAYGLRLLRKSWTCSRSLVKPTRAGSLSALRRRVSESVHEGRSHLRKPPPGSQPLGLLPAPQASCPGPCPPAPRPGGRSPGHVAALPFFPHPMTCSPTAGPSPAPGSAEQVSVCGCVCIHSAGEWSLRVCVCALGTQHLGEAQASPTLVPRILPLGPALCLLLQPGVSPLQTEALLVLPPDASIGPTCGVIAGQGAEALTLTYGFPVAVTIALESWGLGV